MAKIKVGCRIPNGVVLRLFGPGYDDGTGFITTIRKGDDVRLNGPSSLNTGTATPGGGPSGAYSVTEVDAEWFATWLEANKDSGLVTAGAVFEVQEKASEL